MVCHIREKFTINKNTLLRRYIKPEDVEKYVSGEYDAVRGCISREGDCNDVGDFEDIFETFRLDYNDTPYHSFGGSNTLPDPCTQNAFTGSENGKVISEWNLEKGVKYRKDSLITKIERGRVVEQYKFSDGIWRKVK